MRACNRCFKSFPLDNISTVVPDLYDTDDDIIISENIVNDNDYDENQIFNEDQSLVSSDDSKIDKGNDIQKFMDTHAVFSEQDPTLNQTLHNQDNNAAFFTKNSGGCPRNVVHDEGRDSVTGHIIFNQVRTCTRRRNQNIEGTSRQKHLVQSLCATIPGQASTLLQPEAILFPRHFYISADKDRCSILGARPLFLINS